MGVSENKKVGKGLAGSRNDFSEMSDSKICLFRFPTTWTSGGGKSLDGTSISSSVVRLNLSRLISKASRSENIPRISITESIL